MPSVSIPELQNCFKITTIVGGAFTSFHDFAACSTPQCQVSSCNFFSMEGHLFSLQHVETNVSVLLEHIVSDKVDWKGSSKRHTAGTGVTNCHLPLCNSDCLVASTLSFEDSQSPPKAKSLRNPSKMIPQCVASGMP